MARDNWGTRLGSAVEGVADAESGRRRSTIKGKRVAQSAGTTSTYSVRDRVFHLKLGNGNIAAIDGNKLTIDFDKAGQKRVLDGFVERVV